MFVESLVLTFIVAISFALLFHKRIQRFIILVQFYKTLKGPTIPQIIANAKKERVLPFLLHCAHQYGSRYGLLLGTNPFIIITDPEDARIVLGSQELIYKSNNYSLIKRWLGEGLLVAGGPKWQQSRKFLTPAFHFNVLKQFKGAMTECSSILIRNLETQCCTGKPVNIYPFITLFALDVICETALGVKKNAQEKSKSEYVSAVQGISAIIHHRAFNFLMRTNAYFRLTKMYDQEQKVLKVLHGETNSVIRQRREMIKTWNLDQVKDETSGSYYEGTKKRLAFLDMLLIAQLEGREITDTQIREEVDTFMFEGHDTTSSALSFALYLLSRNPEAQELAYREAIEFEDREQENMKYLEAVIKETLRLYPSVPFYSRDVKKPFQLGDMIIPPGMTISVLAFAIHRNPDVYKDYLAFSPERYLDEQKPLHPFANVAFSAGPRNCIGQKFAMLEMKSTLAALLRHFKFHDAKTPEPIPLAELILKSANGVNMIIEKRNT